jgi:hypothetical protein
MEIGGELRLNFGQPAHKQVSDEVKVTGHDRNIDLTIGDVDREQDVGRLVLELECLKSPRRAMYPFV